MTDEHKPDDPDDADLADIADTEPDDSGPSDGNPGDGGHAGPEDGGHVDPDVPAASKTASEGGKVLTPEELEITNSEYVEPLDDDGRYVVSPGGGPPNVSRSDAEGDTPVPDRRDDADDPAPTGPRTPGSHDTPASPESARTLLARELARTDARYGIDMVARFDGETVRHRTASNDVVGTFEDLVYWYARNVTDDTPVDQVIEILLSEASFGSGSDPNLAELLDAHDLDRQDSIADLVAAIDVEAGRDP